MVSRSEWVHGGGGVMQPVPAAGRTDPAVTAAFLPRARLLADLEDGGERTVLVCAPAGFGKTALLEDWVRRAAPAAPVAWVDAAPGAPLWPAVLAALHSCPAVPRGSAVHALARDGAVRPTSAADVV